MAFNTLLVERADGIATVTLNRPKALNAINREMTRELAQVVEEFAQDPAVRVVIITGAGDRAFLAGADINEFQALSAVEALGFSQRIQALYTRIEGSPSPRSPPSTASPSGAAAS